MKKMLEGIDRCRYISEIIDNIHRLVWVKDEDDNLLFANKSAFEFFKSINKNSVVKCPANIHEFQENEVLKMEVNGKEIWLRYSCSPIFSSDEFPNGVLIVADDITEEKRKEKKLSETLDKKISDWKKEKEEKTRRIEKNNKEINELLNLMKNGSLGAAL